MNQPDRVRDSKKKDHAVAMSMSTTTPVGDVQNGSNKCTLSFTTPPFWYTEDESQDLLSPTSSFLSSSPTDVVLSSSTTMFQQRLLEWSPPYQSVWPAFSMSKKAQRTQNPIRAILDPILQLSSSSSSSKNDSGKVQISLALGDPIAVATTSTMSSSPQNTASTASLLPCPLAVRAVLATLQSDHSAAASYTNAIGTLEGRRAIAQYHSHPPYYTYNPESDIIIANGCSGALEILLTSLLDHPNPDGTNQSILLVPAPGFPLYRVIAESHGAKVVSYPLLPHRQWEVDLVQLQNIVEEQQFKDNRNGRAANPTIRGIVINNPSNPTGSVYTTTHLQQIIQLCQQYFIPIIADEIYGDLVFPNGHSQFDNDDYHFNTEHRHQHHPTFVSMAQIAAEMGRIVPVVTASGIGKQFLLPGWRVGWICFQDNIYGSLQQVKDGAKRLAQVVLGASHLSQVAIPALLLTPPTEVNDSIAGETVQYMNNSITEYRRSYSELIEWKASVRNTLHEQSKVLCAALRQIGPCVQVIEPQGAMYALVRINLEFFHNSMIPNDIQFTKLLYQEENVVVLPGTCFNFPNSFRVVFCAPAHILKEAAHRIHQFCHRHLKQ